MESSQDIVNIFALDGRNRRKELDDSGFCLAHYTTAENAYKIFESRALWMRNAMAMDDFSEVELGHRLLLKYFHDDKGRREKLFSIIDRCCGEAGRKAIDLFDKHFDQIRRSTYICCFSEHADKHNKTGRLSMWRAFGKNSTGVAIIFRPPGENIVLPLNVFMVPVLYLTEETFYAKLDGVFERVDKNESYLKQQDREIIYRWVFAMLVSIVTSIKHPGFEEEQEWRLVHLPKTYPSVHVKDPIEVVGGVPQVIYKIDLKNNAAADITGIELPELLERVIIGPSEHGYSIYEALVKKLESIGVDRPWEKVFVSDIPLRT